MSHAEIVEGFKRDLRKLIMR